MAVPAPRMAAPYTLYREPSTLERTIFAQRLDCILAARG